MKDSFFKNESAQLIFFLVVSPFFFLSCDVGENRQDVKIIAHRGAMAERPENTIAAYERAVELGVDIVEIDLRTSRDGYLFVLHDADLDRTTGREGSAAEYTLEELQQLDAGSWFDPEYSGQTIPSAREVMKWARDVGIVLLLDLKEFGSEYAENVTNEVRAEGMEENVIVGVRSPEQARQFRELLPESKLLAFMGSADDIEVYAETGVDVIRLWLSWLEEDPALAERVRNTDTKLMVNGTTGGLEETKKLLSHEPDWILIDDPAQLNQSIVQITSNAEKN